jgi:branched-chain amino acid transport system permease protein
MSSIESPTSPLAVDGLPPAPDRPRPTRRGVPGGMIVPRIVVVIAIALGILVPYQTQSVYYMTVAETVFANVALAISFQLLFGYARLISLGHAAFFAGGAYVAGVLVSQYGFSHPAAWLLAIAAGAVAAVVLGWITLRLEPLLLAIATLAFAQALHSLLAKLTITGGENGLAVPPLSFESQTQPTTDYIVSAAILVLVIIAVASVVLSRMGRHLVAVGDDPVAAKACGIRVSQTLVYAFVVGSVLAAAAGVMYAQSSKLITPDLAGLDTSTLVLAMVALGGVRSMTGAAAGAVLLTLLPEVAAPLQQYNSLIFGGLVLVVFRLAPNGLFGPTARGIWRRVNG